MRIRGPVPFDQFRQRVRRHRRIDVVDGVAALSAELTATQLSGRPRRNLPNVVQPFALAAVARAAFMYGNEHRNKQVFETDLIDMCALYANVHEPALGEDPGGARLRGLMHRTLYEQAGHQFSEMENIGRTLVLFEDHASASAKAPTTADWESLLGTSLVPFMRTGFTMHVAALSNAGQITRDVLRADHVAPVFTPLSADAALEVIDEWYAASIDDLKATGEQAEVAGLEKWSLNPLVARPLVRVGDRYVMPCPRWVIDRFTPTGLYFIGWEAWGSRFTDALGAMFEAYVGTQLGLIEHATVHGEIVYGTHDEKTVDFFVVTDDVVVLVEAKSARPVQSTRLGQPESDEDIDKKVGKAISQINNTARLLREGHSALAHINPKGLPLVGVVVTLEPFLLVNTFVHGLLDEADLPTVVASAHELEGFLGAVHDRADVGQRFVAAVSQPPPQPPSLDGAILDIEARPNPLLDAAWDRFNKPLEDLAAQMDEDERRRATGS